MLPCATPFAFLAAMLPVAALLGASAVAGAQGTSTPGLPQLLTHLDASLHHADADLPSLFCDERVVSDYTKGDLHLEDTVTDSVFRLRRTVVAGHTATLDESREIRSVNGKSPGSQALSGPVQLTGLFEGGLAVVSDSQADCMSYGLEPTDPKHPTAPYIIRFVTLRTPASPSACFLLEPSEGRALIDRTSLQLVHLEIDTPHHAIADGVVGRRQLTVDYTSVSLGGQSFQLPSTISMRAVSGFGFHRHLWTLHATYGNYHRMEVTSRIVPVTSP